MGRDIANISPTKDPLATAVLMLMVGVVMVVRGSGAFTVLVTFIGVLLMVFAARYVSLGLRGSDRIVDLLIGILLAAVGLMLVLSIGPVQSMMDVLVGLLLIVVGVMAMLSNQDAGKRKRTVALAMGALFVVLGLLLIFVSWATSDTGMKVIGVVVIVASALSIYQYVRRRTIF